MILVIIFVSVFLSRPPLLFSATDVNTNCPESFSCPDFGPFKFPFYHTSDTRCGLIKVNCTLGNETIQFGGHSYEITDKYFDGASVIIHNSTFQKLIDAKSCEALVENFTSPTPHLFSISIKPLITLFKCPKQPNYGTKFDTYFGQPSYNSYNRCKNHNFYYKPPSSSTPVPSDLPESCEVIQLPGGVNGVPNYTDIFSLLASQFYISFVSPSCNECRKKDNCHQNHGNFECSNTKKGNKLILIRILVIGLGALLLSVVLLCTICYIKKFSLITYINTFNYKSEEDLSVEAFIKQYGSLSTKRYKYADVKKMTNSFQVKLGGGGFGTVYQGKLLDGRLVAVKVLNSSRASGKDFINEVASIGRISHVNIVSLLGFCSNKHNRALIYEFMPNGSLEKFIHNNHNSHKSSIKLEVMKLYEVALGIARGLDYLHCGCNPRILHLDIKPHNILLDDKFCPKIADFGLAKLYSRDKSIVSMLEARGTIGYIAPEVFSRNIGGVSHKSDVYSYGMLILEMVGGNKDVDFMTGSESTSGSYFPYWIYNRLEKDEYVFDGISSVEENEYVKKMTIVGLWCIQTVPTQRPSIAEVIEMLEGSMGALEVPQKPSSSPFHAPFNICSTSQSEQESNDLKT